MKNDSSDPSNKENKENIDLKGLAGGLLGDALKKVMATAVTGAFMTEEALKTYLSDLKLPKDILNLILQSAQKSKDEFTSKVTKEVVGLLQKVDVVKELSQFAETHKFKITAEIDIIRKTPESQSKKSEES